MFGLSAGRNHGFALMADGTVYGWGSNTYGQVGVGDQADTYTPSACILPGPAKQVDGGGYHTLFLLTDGTVWGAGDNVYGQLGSTDAVFADAYDLAITPVKAHDLANIQQISAGFFYSLALTAEHTVMAWGDNSKGERGDAIVGERLTPQEIPALTHVVEIAAGFEHTVVRLANGEVRAWGWNVAGQLGNGTVNEWEDVVYEPQVVQGISTAIQVVAGWRVSAALLADKSVVAWGRNEEGELATGSFLPEYSTVPVAIPISEPVAKIAVGYYHFMALLEDGRVMVWGDNEYGQLGNNTEGPDSPDPVFAQGISTAVDIAAGRDFCVARLADGTVMAWGDNIWGQLGSGDDVDHIIPEPVSIP
ncbi:MAG: hypothetical protein A2289_20505 [Deltaproteobacteria bacterium RIFOXYA12_FULL_58_15]|nr:MAG: hypothetical protein A2289_20505 [Deltaproteobacteria bacterium RIFOXYA12_FULL_58_15]